MATTKDTHLCEPCSRRNKSTISFKFCTDCDESLCEDCLEVHSSLKSFGSHHVVSLEITQERQFQINKFCVKHQKKEIEFYCSDHDSLCCRACIGSEHRACSNVLPVDDVASDVKSSVLYGEISRDVSDLTKSILEMSEERTKYKKSLKDHKTMSIEGLRKFKSVILSRISMLEEHLMSRVHLVHNELSLTSDKDLEVIDMKKKEIDDISKQLDMITKHGSERQIFILLHSLKAGIYNKSMELQNILKNMKTSKLIYDAPKVNITSMVASLGSIDVQEDSCLLDVKLSKLKHAQNLHFGGKILKSFTYVKSFDTPYSWITGIVMFNDILAMCDWIRPKVLLYTTDGKHIEDIGVSSKPWGITIDGKSNMAWVTLPINRSVQVINMTTRKAENEYKINVDCNGITIINGMVAVGGRGVIYILNMDGSILKNINVAVGHRLYSVKTTVKDTLVCCAGDAGYVYSINQDGKVLFSKTCSEISGPIDSISDLNGKTYVLSWGSNNLVCLSDGGDVKETMLRKADALQQPRAIAFNKDYSQIFISSYTDKKILVFSCIYS